MTTPQPAYSGPRLTRSRTNSWLGGVCGGIAGDPFGACLLAGRVAALREVG